MRKTLASLLVLFSMEHAFALYQYNVTPTLVGSSSDGSVFIGLDINTNSCLYSGVNFDSASNAKAVLAVALTAKASNKMIRIDFNRNASTGVCSGYSIYLL
jgi:hypothetical protein